MARKPSISSRQGSLRNNGGKLWKIASFKKCGVFVLSMIVGFHLVDIPHWMVDVVWYQSGVSLETFTPILTNDITDSWKRNLYEQLDRVQRKCGMLCRINDQKAYQKISKHQPGTNYSTFRLPVDCERLFQMSEIDAADTTVPYPIPNEIQKYYSLNGMIAIHNINRFEDIYLGGKALIDVWKKENIERDKLLLKKGELEGTYGATETTNTMRMLKRHGGLKGKSVLVVGSARPWIETIALTLGATSVTTLEYGNIDCDHPQITTMTPDVFRSKYLAGELQYFDFIIAYSSLEHSGLGRYGDALNPWGDILSLARCWCVAADDSMLMLAVPVGPDSVEFNGHRVYGNVRYPLLTMNWFQADGTEDYEDPPHPAFQYPHFFRKVPPFNGIV